MAAISDPRRPSPGWFTPLALLVAVVGCNGRTPAPKRSRAAQEREAQEREVLRRKRLAALARARRAREAKRDAGAHRPAPALPAADLLDRCRAVFGRVKRCLPAFAKTQSGSFRQLLHPAPSRSIALPADLAPFCRALGARFALGHDKLHACTAQKTCGAFAHCFERVRVRLHQPTNLGRVTCRAGRDFGLHPTGELSFCTVATPTSLSGVTIAKDAYTLFHRSGAVWQTNIAAPRAFVLAGGRRVQCAADLISLGPQGGLRYCKLAVSAVFDGIAARRGEGISFHANGHLFGATLDRPHRAGATTFPAGLSLSFDPKGHLVGGYLPYRGLRVRGLHVRSDFALYPTGGPREVELASDQTVKGRPFKDGAKLWFRGDGSLERAKFVERRIFMPHGEPRTWTRHLKFDKSGKVTDSRVTVWTAPYRYRYRKWRPRRKRK